MPAFGSDLPVIVGVDRSNEALQAAKYALQEARWRNCGLLLVHTSAALNRSAYFTMDDFEEMSTDAESVLEAAVGALREEHGSTVPIRTLLRQGPAGMILADLSPGAQCMVVGRRNSGWGERLLTGSVSSRVSARSECPVVTVPHDWNGNAATMGPVVVAIDTKSSARDLLLYAFRAADHRQCDLVVLHAALSGDTSQEQVAQELDVATVLAGWRSEYPDVAVTTSIVHMSATSACEDASRNGSLLVLGRSSGLHLLPWTRSVAHAVLKNARCPVVTVPLHDAVRCREPAAGVAQSFPIGTF